MGLGSSTEHVIRHLLAAYHPGQNFLYDLQILAVEPGITKSGVDHPDFPDIPVRIMWGDNLPEDGFALTQADLEEARALAAQRPAVSVDWLPSTGIYGNGHMLMMEDNSAELAARSMAWFEKTVSTSPAE